MRSVRQFDCVHSVSQQPEPCTAACPEIRSQTGAPSESAQDRAVAAYKRPAGRPTEEQRSQLVDECFVGTSTYELAERHSSLSARDVGRGA